MVENYSKTEVRTWVQETVENIFKGEIKDSIKSNIKITFEYDDEDGFWASDICVRQWLNGKWELCEYFYFTSYYANYWSMVTDPWVCDMINDITDKVMKFIYKPKKMGW